MNHELQQIQFLRIHGQFMDIRVEEKNFGSHTDSTDFTDVFSHGTHERLGKEPWMDSCQLTMILTRLLWLLQKCSISASVSKWRKRMPSALPAPSNTSTGSPSFL